jgi:hypothetical protein
MFWQQRFAYRRTESSLQTCEIFLKTSIGTFGIEAQPPDEFILNLLDLAPGVKRTQHKRIGSVKHLQKPSRYISALRPFFTWLSAQNYSLSEACLEIVAAYFLEHKCKNWKRRQLPRISSRF